jgi:hypothetical protein
MTTPALGQTTDELERYSLRELVSYFLRLGTTGFGGPIALVDRQTRRVSANDRTPCCCRQVANRASTLATCSALASARPSC